MTSVVRFSDVEAEFTERWASCVPTCDDSVAKTMLRNKGFYSFVSKTIGCPWYVVACLHYREASFNAKTCLHNGDPLPGPTTHVPEGRGPFASWQEAAVDALRLKNFAVTSTWTIPYVLFKLEGYNGFGYRLRHGGNSPYIYSGTQFYTAGKYASDGNFEPALVDKQQGCMAILKQLDKLANPSPLIVEDHWF